MNALELRGDCALCLVEGACIELWSDARCCVLGVAERTACRFCGASRIGVVTDAGGSMAESTPGRVPHTESDLERALERWAREEGLLSAREMVEANFVLGSLPEIFAALQRGERLETTFDVSDHLFGSGSFADNGATPMADEIGPGVPSVRAPVALPGGPRDELLALASIAAADGAADDDDRQVLQRAAERRNVLPLHAAEIRVWRPNELAVPPTLLDRERVLEEMFQLAWADGQMDDSELRTIRDFARAWGVDPERVREWTELYSFAEKTAVARWLGRIALFLFPMD